MLYIKLKHLIFLIPAQPLPRYMVLAENINKLLDRVVHTTRFIPMKKKILYSVLGVFLAIGLLFYEWVYYLGHLASHQLYSFTSKYSIQEIISKKCKEKKESCEVGDINLDQKAMAKLKLILSVKNYGEKIYDLKESNIYKTFVPMKRDILGWAITVAYPLKLEVKNFYFPLIGKYGYLGFFNEDIVKLFEEKFKSDGFDTHRSTTAAYTSLGYFEDPIFSTYLKFSEYRLIRLVLHEMAHLRLYFKKDTNFSESLASFIEEYATEDFIKTFFPNAKLKTKDKARLFFEQKKFDHALNDVLIKLKKLYTKEIADEEKHKQKKVVVQEFRKVLKKMETQNRYVRTEYLLNLKEINNATLLQTSRYNPSKSSGFQTLFSDQCKRNYNCWFKGLKKLEPCTSEQRQMFTSKKKSLDELIDECNDQNRKPYVKPQAKSRDKLYQAGQKSAQQSAKRLYTRSS